nr:protein SCAI isoform X1 [Danaus plexippus plexippus]
MTGVTDQERRVILEFCHLLEKSKQFFNGLRELSPYGQKHWQGQFSRTFDVYAKLWKFQQQKRSTLDLKYGLKRWQIGEIASKIGQLYYHFYLRTSETAYLVEAYSFYSAIRGRRYYTLAIKENKCELMVKKLRFYARFIVVAILLQLPNIIEELVLELEKQVIAYGKTYDPNDQLEWIRVLEEVRAFLVAQPGVTVLDPDDNDRIVTVNGRTNPLSIPPIELTPQMNITLRDAVIIGSGTQLVKFSELTIDMFRMVQVLEFEITVPIRDLSNNSPNPDGRHAPRPPPPPPPPPISIFDGDHGQDATANPHKFLLFKPSPSQALIYLASCCNDLPANAALLLYVSAHGHAQHSKHAENYAYDLGGLITTSKSDIYNEDRDVMLKHRDPQILYPGDLQPYTRKPLFVIVDSDNSFAFQHIPRTFGQPLVILMSPISLPSNLSVRREHGNLFTLFLHNPIAGLCHACDVYTITLDVWDHCVRLRDIFMRDVTRLITRIRLDPMHYAFIGDEFLRLLFLRYIFCECTLRMHRAFRSRNNLPRALPPVPDDLFEHKDLISVILEMADCIGVRGHFYDSTKPDYDERHQ